MQHLNLYHQIERHVEVPFSARQQLRLLGAVAALMVAVYLLLLLGATGAERELNQLGAQQKNSAQALQQLKNQKAQLENDPQLDSDIADLERALTFRRRLISTIAPDGNALKSGFAEHLSGLARQHIDGMWFTEIQLQQGGKQMALLGETRQPEFVPQYLQKLARESVFEGQHFQVLRMYVPEDHKELHTFELRAKEEGKP